MANAGRRVNGVDKGKRAEREVATMLRELVQEAYVSVERRHGYEHEVLLRPSIERNQNQSAVGGYDVQGIAWMACEVKHHADTSNVNVWWQQCVRQAREGQMPVLMFKGTRTGWKVRTVATLQGMPPNSLSVAHWVVVTLDIDDFLRYVRKRLIDDAELEMMAAHGIGRE